MTGYLIMFLVVLLALAVMLREQFVLILLYLLAGTFLISRWWSRQALKTVTAQRQFSMRAFYGEQLPVVVKVKNIGRLPAVWLHLRETLPMEIRGGGDTQRVVSLGSKGQVELEYTLDCHKRGHYPVGPLRLTSGDLLGVTSQTDKGIPAEYLTVFPKIIPLSKVAIPSQSPLGALRHTWPIFEDPSRVCGKRDYIAGDSLRRVDWKASARTSRLQVKLFEPSIALETMIFLNLNSLEYSLRARFEASELGIVVAASLANWVIAQRQAVGLATNGYDPMLGSQPLVLPPRRGRGHLMHLLETLARIQATETFSLIQLLHQKSVELGWGTTLIIITHQVSELLFDSLFQARHNGLKPIIIVCGLLDDYLEVERRAKYFNFPIYQMVNETDLDIWRR